MEPRTINLINTIGMFCLILAAVTQTSWLLIPAAVLIGWALVGCFFLRD